MNREAHEHLEIERKYEVTHSSVMPTSFGHEFQVTEATVFDLRATYFDTDDVLLARSRIAVRNRRGGTDAGWHIKQRVAEGVHESEWEAADAVPEGLLVKLRELTGVDQITLRPIATITTQRTSRMLTGVTDESAKAKPLVELVDDVVTASDRVQMVDRAWREWEAELMPGAPVSTLDQIEPVLIEAGARPSLNESKIGRTMGRALEAATRKGASAEVLASLAITDVADRLAAEAETGQPEPRVGSLRVIARNLIA